VLRILTPIDIIIIGCGDEGERKQSCHTIFSPAWVIGAVVATLSRQLQRRMGEDFHHARALVIHVQSLCAAQPATRRKDRCGTSGTSPRNANVRVVSTETVPKALLDISVLCDPTPSLLPSFLGGRSMVRQTTPLCLYMFSSGSPVHYVDTS